MADSTSGSSSEASLRRDLLALGVEPGDTLFIHSSFKSLGPVSGGAGSVVSALEAAVGGEGTILMPSFNLTNGTQEDRAQVWSLETSPSTVGWITEFFRMLPGTLRSDHPSHSVAARGARARDFVSGHLDNDGMVSPWDVEPWGRTYGSRSPMTKAYADPRAKLLMMGVGYDSATYCHLVETMYWNRARGRNPLAEYRWIKREELGHGWEESAVGMREVRRGRVGRARCRLFRIGTFVEAAFTMVQSDPLRWFK